MSVTTPQDQLNLVMIQANPTVGAIDKNQADILEFRRQHKDADLIVLSECYLTGYPLQDLVTVPHFVGRVRTAIDELAEQIRAEPGPAVLFGAPTAGADKPYNSAILIRPDGTMAVTHKQELPNNDVFDEVRTFAQGSGKAQPLRLNDKWNLGVMICEDGWHEKVAKDLQGEGADLLISLNGSPARLGKQQVRLQHMRRRVADTNLPLVYLNQFGGQDELVFDGASFVLNNKGEVIARQAFMEPDQTAITATRDDRGQVQLEHTHGVAMPNVHTSHDADDLELMYRAGVVGLRDYVDKNNIPFVHIGISGGADSTLVAAMAADAIGPDRVLGYRLPSSVTGQESMDLATEFMQRLGCKLDTVRVDGMAQEFLRATSHLQAGNSERAGMGLENLSPRLRMTALMYACNIMGGMLLGTSNKSESSLGYTTIYGDMAGQYNPIKDLYKTDVWNVMTWRNQNIPVDSLCPVAHPIPDDIITRPPTAELVAGQTDEASLGSYHVLDPLLKGMIEHQLDAQAARIRAEKETGVTILPTFADKIARMIYMAEFKRRQACIGPQIRPNSFGLARRYPITNLYREERPTYDPAQRQLRTPAYR